MDSGHVVYLKPQLQRQVQSHIFYRIIRDWLEKIEAPAKLWIDDSDHAGWSFTSKEGIAIEIALYICKEDKESDLFFWIETQLAELGVLKTVEVLQWLLRLNTVLPFPFRMAMSGDLVIVQCRSYCDGFTPEHFRRRLQTLIPFSIEIQEDLERQFGLKPRANREPIHK